MSRKEKIVSVEIDGENRLRVAPTETEFSLIYRAAMNVNWDPKGRMLYSPPPLERSHARWFQQILAACKDEYGVMLTLDTDTKWSNVPDEIRLAIEQGASA